MRRKIVGIVGGALVCAAPCAFVAGAGPAGASTTVHVKVMSYNVKHPNADADDVGTTSWANRRPRIVQLVNKDAPGIFGLQEVRTDLGGAADGGTTDTDNMETQLEYDFAHPAAGSGDFTYAAVEPASTPYVGVNKRPMLIFYRTDKFTLISSGVTPFSAGPTDCDANPQQSVAWAVLEDTTAGQYYFVANTHLTNDSDGTSCTTQREAEAHTIKDVITANDQRTVSGTVVRDPIILLGDLNTDNDATDSDVLSILNSPYTGSDGPTYNINPTVPLSDDGATYNSGWDSDHSNDTQRLDYIWYTVPTMSVSSAAVDRTEYTLGGSSGTYTPSDHYAVAATLTVP
jgi:endonuclease/exonuclease/phosphatase family metal-dependent hydrolase